MLTAARRRQEDSSRAVSGTAGAAFAADGKSIDNVLGSPGLFRGALDVGARRFRDDMLIAAAGAIGDMAVEGDLVPDVLDGRVDDSVADTVRHWVVSQ